jgi:hypothetical protein
MNFGRDQIPRLSIGPRAAIRVTAVNSRGFYLSGVPLKVDVVMIVGFAGAGAHIGPTLTVDRSAQ